MQLYSYAHTVRDTTANIGLLEIQRLFLQLFNEKIFNLHSLALYSKCNGRDANWKRSYLQKFWFYISQEISQSICVVRAGIFENDIESYCFLNKLRMKLKELKADDCSKRMEFSFWLLENLDVLSQISWSDEVCLHLNREINRYHCRIGMSWNQHIS